MFAAIMIEIQSLHVGSALRFSHSSFHIIIAKGLWSILTFTCSKSTIESQEKGVKKGFQLKKRNAAWHTIIDIVKNT